MVGINNEEPSFWNFKGFAEYTDKKFLIINPFPVVFIIMTYLWFVLKFGPEFMKNRKPYKLQRVLVIYNFIQVVISIYTLFLGHRIVRFDEIIHVGWNSPICYSAINYEKLADSTYFYLISKVIELFDTVFFVLRKKQSQVSFLHVYHHTTMVVCTWCVTKYSASDSMIFIGLINSLVHIIMYSYYGLSLFPGLKKYLWWKKYITIFQLVQFFLIFINIIANHFVSSCEKSYILLCAVTFNVVFFSYLFGDFYIKAYMKGRQTVTKIDLTQVTNDKSGLNYLVAHHKLAAKIN